MPWHINKAVRQFQSPMNQNFMANLSPATGLVENFYDGLFQAGRNAIKGDFEGTTANLIKLVPFGREALGYAERFDIPIPEDRPSRAKGGIIENVPNAPEEPDQRIDKMTGMPYAPQAGTAFVDEEDPLRRLGFGLGSLVARQVSKAIRSTDGNIPTTVNKDDLIQEFDGLTSAINKGETPKIFEVEAEPVTMLTPSKPLDIGIDESMADGSKLKNYSIAEAEELDSLIPTATAGTKAADKLILAPVAEGTKAGVRLNLNSKIEGVSTPALSKLQTVHKNNYSGKALSYAPYVTLTNAKFTVNQKGRVGIASKIKGLDVPEAKNKFPAMSVDGSYTAQRNVLKEMDDDVVEIGINPAGQHLFIDLKTGQAVESADIATVIGDRVYAKGVKYFKKAEAPNPLAASDGTDIGSTVRYRRTKGGKVLRALKGHG